MTGNELLANKAYDHYLIKMEILNPSSDKTIESFMAETFICSKDSVMNTTIILTDDSVNLSFNRPKV